MVTPKASFCAFFAFHFATSSPTGTNVVILTEESPHECGRSLTLTCKVESYTSSVEWQNENDVIAIANCVRKKCDLNHDYAKKYSFTQDISLGMFNLTFNTLTMNDNASKLVCSDGYFSDSYTVIVRDDENEDHGKSDDRQTHHEYTLILVIVLAIFVVVLAGVLIWMNQGSNMKNKDGAKRYKELIHCDTFRP